MGPSRVAIALCAVVVACAALGVEAQRGLAQGDVFEPVIVERLPRHRPVEYPDRSRLPLYPPAHWSAEDQWQPAAELPQHHSIAAAPHPPVVKREAAAATAPLVAALDQWVGSDQRTAQVLRDIASHELESQNAVRSLSELLNQHSTQLSALAHSGESVSTLVVQMAKARAAVKKLSELAIANRVAIAANKHSAEADTHALEAAVAAVKQQIAALQAPITALAQRKEKNQRLKRQMAYMFDFITRLKRVVWSLGAEVKADTKLVEKDHKRLGKDHKLVKRDHRRLSRARKVVSADHKLLSHDHKRLAKLAKSTKKSRRALRSAMSELTERMMHVEQLSAQRKALLDEEQREIEAVKNGDHARDQQLKALATNVAALETRLAAAESAANDAHHKAAAASDAIAGVKHAQRKQSSDLAAVRAMATDASDALPTVTDHTRQLERLKRELEAVSKRLDATDATARHASSESKANSASLKQEISRSATAHAETAREVKANTAREKTVTHNAETAQEALDGLAAITKKLAKVESELVSSTKATQTVADSVKAMQIEAEKAARTAAVRHQQEIKARAEAAAAAKKAAAESKALAAAQARALAIAKAKAAAEAAARAKAEAVAKAQAIAIAKAKAIAQAQAIAAAQRAKAEALARAKALAQAKAVAQAKAIAQAKALAQAKAAAVHRAKLAAQAQAQAQAQARAKAAAIAAAKAKAAAIARARAIASAKAQAKAKAKAAAAAAGRKKPKAVAAKRKAKGKAKGKKF